jgi:RNA polymerase sigma factor (sigma-70 family)
MDNEENKIELFRRMFCEHYPRLVRLAVQLTGDDDEGRDVVSDVMETAWRNFGGIDTARYGTWLRTCVYNACLNRLKHRDVESRHAALIAEAGRTATDADSRERERLLRLVEAVAGRLEEPTRTIIRLCYYEHNTYSQTAARLGISPETVKKHIRKALRMMREEIKIQED